MSRNNFQNIFSFIWDDNYLKQRAANECIVFYLTIHVQILMSDCNNTIIIIKQYEWLRYRQILTDSISK